MYVWGLYVTEMPVSSPSRTNTRIQRVVAIGIVLSALFSERAGGVAMPRDGVRWSVGWRLWRSEFDRTKH